MGTSSIKQTGSSVQKRASEILPGDIVWLKDAKLKGHKGLHTYTQHVGEGDEACVGVVSEFEAKKFKVRVFQANQHVGQQTVESVSYRMEDLKSGVVKWVSERGLVRFQPGEEWKKMLYEEYERISLGKIKILKTLCHEPVEAPRRRCITANYGDRDGPEAQRIVEIASIVDGREESLPLLAVRYAGRDAKKVLQTASFKWD
ncbi:assembly of actin patch protein [Marasmius tenuissimus]|uniref:Assembly of actin patch protein n=1 Tax=Marasmius tenuissimus TaxID=585030 RepID=A0ABR2ZMU5_9AGAR